MTRSKNKGIDDILQTWLKENSEDFSKIDFIEHRNKGYLHIQVLSRKGLINEEQLLKYAEAAKYFREKTGLEVWFEVRVFFHAE